VNREIQTTTPAATGPHRKSDEYDLLMRDLEVVSIAKDEFNSPIDADPINISASALAWLNAYVIPTLAFVTHDQ